MGAASTTPTTSPNTTPTVDQSASPDPGAVADNPSGSPSGASSNSPSASGPLVGPSDRVISYLEDLDTVANQDGCYTGSQAVDGSIYPHSLYGLICPSSCGARVSEYDLSRNWTVFHAILGIDDQSSEGIVVQYEVFGDGKPIGKPHRLSLGQHYDFTGDVSGVLRLKIQVSWVSGDAQATAVWGDASIQQ